MMQTPSNPGIGQAARAAEAASSFKTYAPAPIVKTLALSNSISSETSCPLRSYGAKPRIGRLLLAVAMVELAGGNCCPANACLCRRSRRCTAAGRV